MSKTNANPYVGLRPYKKDESLLFFGRKEQTLELLKRLHTHRFVAVVGSSGSGKSSLIRAGLIPALKGGFLVEDSDLWLIASMKPGQNPLGRFARSILNELIADADQKNIDELIENLRIKGAEAILDLITPIRKEKNCNFFLLVDQFEELFRIALKQKDQEKRDDSFDFVNIILELSNQKQIPFHVVITMRSDFIGDCDQFYGLPEAMNLSQFLVSRLNRTQLKRAIEGPAKLFGAQIDPLLTSILINELNQNQNKDGLPVLQHALNRTWTEWEKKDKNARETDPENYEVSPIDHEHYEKVGEMSQALDWHAEEAFTQLDEGRPRVLCEKMFKALTEVDIEGRRLRRPTKLGDLCKIIDAKTDEVIRIIDVFRDPDRSFLTPSIENTLTDEDYIDISHESFMRIWERLIRWMDEESESSRTYRRLTDIALDYKTHDDLLHGSFLKTVLEWQLKEKPNEHWAKLHNDHYSLVEDFLTKSEKKWQLEKQEENKLREKKLLAEEQAKERKIKAEERKRTRSRMTLIGAFTITVLILVAIGVFQQQKLKNYELSDDVFKIRSFITETDSLIDILVTSKGRDPFELLKINEEAIKSLDSAMQFKNDLQSASYSLFFFNIFDDKDIDIVKNQLSPDYKLTERRLKRQTAITLANLVDSLIMNVHATLDSLNRGLKNDPTELLQLNQRAFFELDYAKNYLDSIKLSSYNEFEFDGPDRDREFDRMSADYKFARGNLLKQTQYTVMQDDAFYSSVDPIIQEDIRIDKRFVNGIFPDKKDPSRFQVWPVDEETLNAVENKGTIKQILFPDTSNLAMALFEDGTGGYWNLKGEFKKIRLDSLKAHFPGQSNNFKIYSIAPIRYDTIGYKILSAVNNGAFVEWDLIGTIRKSVEIPAIYRPELNSKVTSIAISRERDRIFTATDQRRGLIWFTDISKVEILDNIEFSLRQGVISCSVFSNRDSLIATGSVDGSIKIWDAHTGNPFKELNGHKSPVNAVAFSKNNEYLFSGSMDGTFRRWKLPKVWGGKWNVPDINSDVNYDSAFVMTVIEPEIRNKENN